MNVAWTLLQAWIHENMVLNKFIYEQWFSEFRAFFYKSSHSQYQIDQQSSWRLFKDLDALKSCMVSLLRLSQALPRSQSLTKPEDVVNLLSLQNGNWDTHIQLASLLLISIGYRQCLSIQTCGHQFRCKTMMTYLEKLPEPCCGCFKYKNGDFDIDLFHHIHRLVARINKNWRLLSSSLIPMMVADLFKWTTCQIELSVWLC